MQPRSGDWTVTIDFLQEAANTTLSSGSNVKINLAIDPVVASGIVALRPALESMVIRASKEPETITELSPLDEKVVSVIRQLVKLNAGRHELDPVGSGGGRPPRGHMSRGFDDGPPAKRMRGGGGKCGPIGVLSVDSVAAVVTEVVATEVVATVVVVVEEEEEVLDLVATEAIREVAPTEALVATEMASEEEVVLRVSYSSLMSSDRMKPGSGDWALTIDFLQEATITTLSSRTV
uniref:Uncharacterized protein n=1 Tax=Timema monikensis TaxID=170555 RepID=A0A7R9EKR1_9NEOP|nr:unnamed protein product [Timema monikensis]